VMGGRMKDVGVFSLRFSNWRHSMTENFSLSDTFVPNTLSGMMMTLRKAYKTE
jgi:hypothetical protein